MFYCPKCNFNKSSVYAVQNTVDNEAVISTIRRYRKCDRCKANWVTFEINKDLFLETIEELNELKSKNSRYSHMLKVYSLGG